MQIERYRGGRPVYFRPFYGLRGLQDEMNRVFSDYFDESAEKSVTLLTPAVDLVDTPDSIQVKVELPGVKKEDVEITLKEDVLTIRGEKKVEKEEKGENRYYVERSYGSFSRSLNLPSSVGLNHEKYPVYEGSYRTCAPIPGWRMVWAKS